MFHLVRSKDNSLQAQALLATTPVLGVMLSDDGKEVRKDGNDLSWPKFRRRDDLLMLVGWEQVGRESQCEVLLCKRPTLSMFAICCAILLITNLNTSEVKRKSMLDSILLLCIWVFSKIMVPPNHPF